MNISSEQLTLYAGGGLLASSELEDEWLETEKKMQTMLNLDVYKRQGYQMSAS